MTSADSLASILERTRQNLLDLSLRNRLINTPRGIARSKRLDIVDEFSDEIFRLLVQESKSMGFLPRRDELTASDAPSIEATSGSASQVGDESVRLSQPEDEPTAEPAARHRDNQLQTDLTSPKLQERLLGLYYDSRTFEEEQGVSILYLAIGFLEWYETDSSDKPRFAPLMLLPVNLSRASVSSRFKLRFRDDDLETNLSLQAKLRQEFGIDLPEIGAMEGQIPSTYFTLVQGAITGQPRWKIHPNEMALWFFSFSKYLMYRDLDPATWPTHSPLADNLSLRRLLVDGFETAPPLCGELESIDPVILPQHLLHVTEADSSQAIVIEEVRRGHNLVVQGPPGTGKSQTITNLIATAVHAGKKVLFVAEKMAALDVVKSRLDRLGLGATCLELHSHKANKKSTLEELNRTFELKRPRISSRAENLQQLTDMRDRLNRHADLMNTPIERANITPYQILGHLVACQAEGLLAISFTLPEPTNWTQAEFEERCRTLGEMEHYVQALGDLAQHPWRGVCRTKPILPSELQQLIVRVRGLTKQFDELSRLVTELCTGLTLSLPADLSLRTIQRLTLLARHCSDRPVMDRSAISDSVWEVHPAKVQRLVERGLQLSTERVRLDNEVTPAAWTLDLSTTRTALATHGNCWCWFVYPDYWRAISSLRGIMKGDMPPRLKGQIDLVDRLMVAQSARQEIRETGPSIGLRAFGTLWNDDTSNFPNLEAIVSWEQKGREAQFEVPFRTVSATVDDTNALKTQAAAIHERTLEAQSAWQEILQILPMTFQIVFGVDDLTAIPLVELKSRFGQWEQNSESLSTWIGYQVRRAGVEQAGLKEFVVEFERGSFDSSQIVARFRQTYYEALLKSLLEKQPELAAFHGSSHEQSIRQFQRLDVGRMDVARSEVALTHFTGIPRESNFGEMAVVRGEIMKKRMHRPIRQLLRDAGRAVQTIKPVFMMSPISVAQFLEPGVLEFDLLVMDEASQVTPEDALGAIARSKQIVVVGDSRQLPPSRFFSKLLDESETVDEGDQISASHLDSVLGLCVARGLPQRMLRWHYRSRHHSLIAVSNQEFYDDQLCVIPSPKGIREGSGLHFRWIPDGRFDRGGTATNRREAAIIADAVIEHARQRPTQSLGVASFSVAQRDAIRDELESRLRKNPGLDEFFATDRHESFFVKNLENVQGDERDFIFISVGYAPDTADNLTMNFGPLGMDGGERRLNVLISRAKECCVVFSSIKADQIDLTRARSRGAAALKTFLKYAETGLLERTTHAERTSEDEFARQVSVALEQAGLTIDSQVGTSGFAIDLTVVDAESEDCHLLGIEFDGAAYHASRWARDRDRLRESVLTDRGWQLHRVWCADWFHRPAEELGRVLEAVERSRCKLNERETIAGVEGIVAPSPQVEMIEREEQPIVEEPDSTNSVAYLEADFDVPEDKSILDLDTNLLQKIATRIVSIESPVHRTEVARRVLSLWKQPRLGPALVRKIDAAIDLAIQSATLIEDTSQFLSDPSQTEVIVRSRSQVTSTNLRKPEYLPPSEIRASMQQLVNQHMGITYDQLFSAVARQLGLKVVAPRLRAVFEARLKELLETQVLQEREARLYVAIPSETSTS